MEKFPNEPADPHSDLARLLPGDAFQQILLMLRSCLPAPRSDDPGEMARRDRAAMAGVASLLPRNAAEGLMAAQFVAADAWAMDCLRQAGEWRQEVEVAGKCRAQALGMMREAKSALRALLQMQAARQKLESDEAGANRAAWVERSALGIMREALDALPGGPAAKPVTQRPKSAVQKPVSAQGAAPAGPSVLAKFQLISNTGAESLNRGFEIPARLTVVPATPVSEPGGSRTDDTKPAGAGKGWKGRWH